MNDEQFERELEIFRTETEAGAQFFYAYLAVHSVGANSKPVYALLNETPLFWNTILGALQTAAFIALGRVFDKDCRAHSLEKLFCVARDNPQLFSRDSLRRRKRG